MGCSQEQRDQKRIVGRAFVVNEDKRGELWDVDKSKLEIRKGFLMHKRSWSLPLCKEDW